MDFGTDVLSECEINNHDDYAISDLEHGFTCKITYNIPLIEVLDKQYDCILIENLYESFHDEDEKKLLTN